MKIMVCYDGTEPAKRAVRLAGDQAVAFGGQVKIVRTLEKGTPDHQDDINEANRELEYMKGVVTQKGVDCSCDLLIRGLEPGEDLIQFAKDRQIDLMVIGIVRKSKVGKLFFGSTAQYVILKAPCPVLTVR